ncbi:MAG: SpoIIE family protein phosphatase [Leptospiraceae bacterium]|nr:SpoIIE family protein phosphatase [Leptospiraceae bacterium]
MNELETTTSICILCNQEKTPDGITTNGIFNCITCGKEWILEKRKSQRFSKTDTVTDYANLITEFVTIFDSNLDLKELCEKTLSIFKTKFGFEKSGFVIHEPVNSFFKFERYLGKSESVITKLKTDSEDHSHPFTICCQKGKPQLRTLSDENNFDKTYKKITDNTVCQILIPIIYKTTTLGLLVFDFDDPTFAEEKFKHLEIFELISNQIAVALYHTIIFNKSNTKYRQFVNLHSSGLTLNKLYLNNTLEIIKMSLLTISGLVDTDINVLFIYNHKFKVITSHKLLRTIDSLELTQDSIVVENFEEYKSFFNKQTPTLISTEQEPLAKKIGFTGKQILNLPSFTLEVNDYVFLLGRYSTRLFTPDEVEVLTAYSELVKITIDNAFMYHKMAKQERLEKEIEIAKEIQHNLLPREMPLHPRYEFAGLMIPAREIGGDYYDLLVSPNQNETIFAIGDVSGKGLPAGMVMVTARTIIHSVIRRLSELKEIVRELNSYLYYNSRNAATMRFMSLTCLKWNHDSNEFYYCGSGHGNLLIYRAKTKEVEIIFTGGTILGIMPDISEYYSEGKVILDAGDSILMYTDGVTESMNLKGDPLEEEGLIESFKKYNEENSQDILDGIYKDLKDFSVNVRTQHDDITMLLIKRNL